MYRLGPHARIELVTVLLYRIKISFFSEGLATLKLRHPRVDHDMGFKVEHALDFPECHVE